ncbi:type 1 glycerol-3-phosphate oxidase [Streptococcus cuniculi]|uniref:Alpha-glycerophosphate oxidase n=1 Tax=Streptococcus cuniculi TaxID=1432788 RepID=A0A4Y9JCI1_9STRE|nr:type 1 glycerol-3-phosphate oxidase [Streptococcus cuniculi]MBF0777655.1 type 1 glycerol-3-phosphate oxidase [Streptococcus cuniculi]TFU98693.1 type 1 glycerol-3-phosphate oxidase [Streptococcus cuniculi]
MEFSKETRRLAIEKMQDRQLDLLIIGGGITGAGVALQAAASGMETALIEMQDFAEGTSSRSTKLVHGGLRYLKQFDVEVVSDTVSERAIVQQIAPHIPKPDPMLLPVYDEEGSTFSMFRLKVAMDLYDLLAGVNNTDLANKVLTKEEVLEREPHLKQEGLVGGGVYLDFRNNDARLVIENIKRAAKDGALIASRVKAERFIKDEKGKVVGIVARDLLTDSTFEIRARLVINTTGPWSDEVRNLGGEGSGLLQMRPTKGVHLVVDSARLSVPQPTYFDTGHADGRMVFVLPRENKTYFGTTDTDYIGDLANPMVTQEDVDYLLDIVNNRFPGTNLTLDDIESGWAGLRPLLSGNGASDYNGGNNGKLSDDSFNNLIDTVKAYLNNEKTRDDVEHDLTQLEGSVSEKTLAPSAVSRGSSLDRDDNGLLILAGGKITDFRKMAEGALEKVAEILAAEHGRKFRLVNSKTYPVSGGELNPANVAEEIEHLAQLGVKKGLHYDDALYLANLYGSNAPKVFALNHKVEAVSQLNQRDLLSLHYAMKEEMALTAVDYLLRRTNYMLFMREQLDAIVDDVLLEMAAYYGWSEEEQAAQRALLDETLVKNDLAYLKNK